MQIRCNRTHTQIAIPILVQQTFTPPAQRCIHRFEILRSCSGKFILCIANYRIIISAQLHIPIILNHHNLIIYKLITRIIMLFIGKIFHQFPRTVSQIRHKIDILSLIQDCIYGNFISLLIQNILTICILSVKSIQTRPNHR